MSRPEHDPSLDLPADLVAFLSAGKQLQYDADACEAGGVTLLPLDELKLERFPMETSSLPIHKDDPHYPEVNSYLVLGVNLVAHSDNFEDESAGILMWLPVERRYGVWDSSHCTIRMFPADVTWTHIAADPLRHINAGWTGMDPDAPPMELLVPWPAHPYADEQLYDPQPA